MNILLLAIDTLSARHMSCYGYKKKTSPFTDKYAKDHVLFESLYCQAIPTHPTFTSTMTGQYAITHGVVSHGGAEMLPRQTTVLAQVLEKNGYLTCAADNLVRGKDWFGWGYEYYINPALQGDYFLNKSATAPSCEEYNARVIRWLKNYGNEKFFLFVHYWEPHTPYIPPEKYRNLFYKGDPCDKNNKSLERLWEPPFYESWGKIWKRFFDELKPGITDAEYITAMYDSEIRYADDGVQELLNALEELGLADDTAVIIFGDHGEEMYKHQIFFNHHGLYDEDIHVPLIIAYPKAKRKGARIPYLVQHIDIAPTILDIAGLPTPNSMEGKSLVPYINGELDEFIYPFLVTEECTTMMKWALRTSQYKYILSREQDYRGWPMRELYDLKADHEELNNIAESEPELAKELENRLEGWIASMMKKNGLTQDPLVANGISLGPDWAEKLEKFGVEKPKSGVMDRLSRLGY